MKVSLTELRQRLFELADRVIDTGEAVVIERRGVRLRIVREESAPSKISRLSRLVEQDFEIGLPLDPNESPAEWSELPDLKPGRKVAEAKDVYGVDSGSTRSTSNSKKARRR